MDLMNFVNFIYGFIHYGFIILKLFSNKISLIVRLLVSCVIKNNHQALKI